MSISSLISASRWRPATRMRSTLSRSSSPRSDSCSSWVKPSTAFSGVRSSWLVLDRNAFLAWVALSASSRAVISSALYGIVPSNVTSSLNCLTSVGPFLPAIPAAMPTMPARMPSASPAKVTRLMADSSRVIRARRAVRSADGPAARSATCIRSRSMVAFPASS